MNLRDMKWWQSHHTYTETKSGFWCSLDEVKMTSSLFSHVRIIAPISIFFDNEEQNSKYDQMLLLTSSVSHYG